MGIGKEVWSSSWLQIWWTAALPCFRHFPQWEKSLPTTVSGRVQVVTRVGPDKLFGSSSRAEIVSSFSMPQ